VKKYKVHIGMGLALIGVGALAFLQPYIDPYYLQVALYLGINLILALGLHFLCGYTGQFSLGHAGFMSIGAYSAAFLSLHFFCAWPDPIRFMLSLLFSGFVSGCFGWLLGLPSLQLKGDYLAVTTLGFGEIIRVVIQNLDVLGGARGLGSIPKWTGIFPVFGLLILGIGLLHFLISSTYGKGFLAVRDDEVAAQAIGIHVTRYKVVAFVISAVFAGIGGALYAHLVTYITPSQFGFMKSIELAAMVILGGTGNAVGVMISVTVLTVLPELLRGFAQYRMVVYALSLVVVMIFRPKMRFWERKKSLC